MNYLFYSSSETSKRQHAVFFSSVTEEWTSIENATVFQLHEFENIPRYTTSIVSESFAADLDKAAFLLHRA